MKLGLENIMSDVNMELPINDNLEYELLIAHMQCEQSMSTYVDLQEECRSLNVALENLTSIYDLSLTGELSNDLIEFLRAPLMQLGYDIADGATSISSEAVLDSLKKGGVWLKDKLLELLAALIDSIKYMFSKNRRYVAASMKRIYNYNTALKKINSAKRAEMDDASKAVFTRVIAAGPKLIPLRVVLSFPNIINRVYGDLQKVTISDLTNPNYDLWNNDMAHIGLEKPNTKTDLINNAIINKTQKSMTPTALDYTNFKELSDTCNDFNNNTKQLFKDDKQVVRIHKKFKKEIESLYKEGKVSKTDRNVAAENLSMISNYMSAIAKVGSACTYTLYFLTTLHDKDMTIWMEKNKKLGKDMQFKRQVGET